MDNTLFKKIISSSFAINTLKLSLSNVVMMFLPLIVTPILSRLYSPESYGQWGVFSSVFYIINSVIFLSYENVIIKTQNRREVPRIIILCLMIANLIIILSVSLFYLGRYFSIPFFKTFPSITLLAVTLTGYSAYSIFSCFASRENKFGIISIANVINGLTQAALRITFGFLGFISVGLIVGNALAFIISALFLLFFIIKSLQNQQWGTSSIESLKKIAIKYKQFPLYDAPTRFIDYLIGNIITIVLAISFSSNDVGCFSMVMQFVLLPISVIGSAIANVYFKSISEVCDNHKEVLKITTKVTKMCFVLSLLPMLFLCVGGDHFLVYFLGDKWGRIGDISLCLAICSMPIIISEPLLPSFRVFNKQDIRFRYNILNLIVTTSILFLVSYIFKNLYFSLIIYAISYSFFRFLTFYQVTKIIGFSATDINAHFYLILLFCYLLLMFRICLIM